MHVCMSIVWMWADWQGRLGWLGWLSGWAGWVGLTGRADWLGWLWLTVGLALAGWLTGWAGLAGEVIAQESQMPGPNRNARSANNDVMSACMHAHTNPRILS